MANFFLAEMSDETQIATVMLAAKYDAYASVAARTMLDMVLANAPVVWFSERIKAGAAAYRASSVNAGICCAGPAGSQQHDLTATGRLSALLYSPRADLLSLRALKKYS